MTDFYDKVYDAWREGYNPDLVSQDLYDDYLSQGYEPDEISLRMVYLDEIGREREWKQESAQYAIKNLK